MARRSMVYLLLILFAAFIIPSVAVAKKSFREQFIYNYKNNRFQAQVILVKRNKAILEQEIRKLIEEAHAPGLSFRKKMELLDLASAMATMHMHWNKGSKELVDEIAKLQKEEIAKEKERKAFINSIHKVERVPGNFVMLTHFDEMQDKGLSSVIYPHWVHRLFFRCKVCHEDIFKMARGTNPVTQKSIQEGKYCGACHNGTIAFDAASEKECERCHILGKPEATRLVDLSLFKPEDLTAIAERVGATWHVEKLKDGKYPLDRFGFIDWIALEKSGAFTPASSLNTEDGEKEEIRDNKIFFKSTSKFMKNVIFDHKIHSTWVKCSLCHPALFKPELGANKIRMRDMSEGKSCGKCHGKVSFTYADCKRCHNHKGEPPEGVLIRTPKDGATPPAQKR